jgi:hypothetical protein
MTRHKSLVYGKKTPIISLIKGKSTALFVLFFVFLSSLSVAGAVGLVGEEFVSDGTFKVGSIVSIDKNNPESIELSSLTNSDYLLGVVANQEENSVTFSKEGSKTTVTLSGEVEVFVSDANGVVRTGDFIGSSWLEGVGMKSLESDKQKLLGVALEDYNSAESRFYGEIDTDSGKKNISIDAVKIRLFEKEGTKQTIAAQSGIENILSNIAGKEVSYAKVLACSILFLITLIVSGMFIVSSIKGSFISMGRNPLASASIYKSLLHVSGLSVLVLIIGTALTYVVLVV